MTYVPEPWLVDWNAGFLTCDLDPCDRRIRLVCRMPPPAGPYPLQSGTLTVFKTTADRSAERSDRPPELYMTSNGLPEHNTRESAVQPIGHVPAGSYGRWYTPNLSRSAVTGQLTRKPVACRRHMLVTAPTAGGVVMILLSQSHETFPAVALLSVSSCCIRFWAHAT
jgi:hypothetical protein